MTTTYRTFLLVTVFALSSAARAAGSPVAPKPAAQPATSPSADVAGLVVEEQAAETVAPAPAGEERRTIGEYIRVHSGDVNACYEKRLQEAKTLQGKMVTRFDIGPNGHVIGASAEGLTDKELVTCVMKVVRSWEFEKPQSGAKLRVAYPWVFTPAKPK
jgi:outer membrane biosynthesis protein TonB